MLITKYFFLGVSGVSVAEFKTVHQSYVVTLKTSSLFTLRCVPTGVFFWSHRTIGGIGELFK